MLLTLCDGLIFPVFWSATVLQELSRTLGQYLVEHGHGDGEDRVDRLIRQMNLAFPYAQVETDPLPSGVEPFELPDPQDVHIVHGALVSKASLLCSWNLRDFPEDVLSRTGLKAVTPDELLTDLISARSAAGFDVLEVWLAGRHRPSHTQRSLVERLQEVGLRSFAATLAANWNV